MKKQLIAVGLAGLLTIPAVSFGQEMAGASLYGSFRTGIEFGSGNASVGDFGSRWGITGSHEVSEGLTASYKYEAKMNTTNAESSGGVGHSHDGVFVDLGSGPGVSNFATDATDHDMDVDGMTDDVFVNKCIRGDPFVIMRENEKDAEEITGYEPLGAATEEEAPAGATCGILFDEDGDSGPGGRHSSISLSGGFGTVTLGQFWSATAIHYGFKLDPSYVNGLFGGASYRPGNSVSYSSNAGDVSFQIDKVTGEGEKIEFGATANLGPVGIGLGYWDNANNEGSFTGVAISAGAAGVNLTIGLGSTDDKVTGEGIDTSMLLVGGSLGDSGISYALQVTNSDEVNDDDEDISQNLIILTNSLGSGASIIFEHLDPAVGDSSSLIGLKVDF